MSHPKANDKQIGGMHYKSPIQHWDYVASNNLDYFQGQITKYVTRWKHKGGVQDLQKARHFLDKYIELQGPKEDTLTTAIVNMHIARERDVSRGELHPSITVPGSKEVMINCTCHMKLESPCPVHGRWEEEGGPTRAYVDQG